MSDDFSARLALPYLAAGQMQKHVTLNTALTRLDALLQTAAVSRTTAMQPAEPADGDLYILPAEAEGPAWAGRSEGDLMRFEAGGWTAVPTPPGLVALVLDVPAVWVRGEAGWTPLGAVLGEAQGLERLGLGTTADAVNPLSAKLNAALFTARGVAEGGDGDLRLTFNKAGAGDVLSLLFQSGYAACAELGLIGEDDLGLKTCDEAGVWRSVLRVERATGRAVFDQGAVRRQTVLMTADGGYAPPAWARWIEAVCIGGGGAGGAGASGPAGTARFGGGGGGAGGISRECWAAEDLAGGLSVTVGAGGQDVGGQGAGGESRIATSGVVLLRAAGGSAGSAGTSAAGAGGLGGLGLAAGNPGGASAIASAGGRGGETQQPDGPGGGAGGGGLSAGDAARAGGTGGAGGWSTLRTPGGAAGAAGGSPDPALSLAGGGGGGGNASAEGTGAAGGPGGGFGAGGGGGGAGLTAGGAGGSGAGGVVRITAVG